MAMVLKAITDQSSPGVRRKGEIVMGSGFFWPQAMGLAGLGEGGVDFKSESRHLLKNPKQRPSHFLIELKPQRIHSTTAISWPGAAGEWLAPGGSPLC